MARARARARGRKAKRKTMWTGQNRISVLLDNATITAILLWDPALYTQLGIANVTLLRTVGTLQFTPVIDDQQVAWYFGVYDTGSSDTVPAALISAPITSDVDVLEKKTFFGFGSTDTQATLVGSIAAEKIDWKSKRKLGGNKAFMLVAQASLDNSVQMTGSIRCLVGL